MKKSILDYDITNLDSTYILILDTVLVNLKDGNVSHNMLDAIFDNNIVNGTISKAKLRAILEQSGVMTNIRSNEIPLYKLSNGILDSFLEEQQRQIDDKKDFKPKENMNEEMMNLLLSIDKNRFLSGTKDTDWKSIYKLKDMELIEEEEKHKYILTKSGREFLHPIIRIPNDVTLLTNDELVNLDIVLNYLKNKQSEGSRGYWDIIDVCREIFKNDDRTLFRTIDSVFVESGLFDVNTGGNQEINKRGLGFDSFISENNRQLVEKANKAKQSQPQPNININMGDGGIAGVNSTQFDLRPKFTRDSNNASTKATTPPKIWGLMDWIVKVIIPILIGLTVAYISWRAGWKK